MKKKIDHKILVAQIEDLTNKWKRALADYANLEKRIEGNKQSFVNFANADLIFKLLGVLDNLEKAEVHLHDQGLTLAVNQFQKVLKDEGVEEIKTLGQKFDPKIMDCTEVIQGKEGIVLAVTQKGYLLKEKVIRPAKVKVGKENFKIKKEAL